MAAAQTPRPHRVGFLHSSLALGVSVQSWLGELGYVEGENLTSVSRAGQDERLPELARELVRSGVSVIVAIGTPAIRAAGQATSRTPIVMVAERDPVRAGLVASLARPGGNVTGITVLVPELSAKRLEMLREAVPALRRAAVLWNPAGPGKSEEWGETEAAARALGLEFHSAPVRSRADLASAFEAAVKRRSEALLVLADALILGQAKTVADLAAKHRLPAIYPSRYFVEPGQGGLLSFGPNLLDLSRRAASYVDKLLKGAKPGELPVEQPTAFELVVNARAARALGLTLPPSILVRADNVIE
ncbi:MAG: ABC transporter substrate-binding protein [Candidatus Rokuibacteriota bacterium]